MGKFGKIITNPSGRDNCVDRRGSQFLFFKVEAARWGRRGLRRQAPVAAPVDEKKGQGEEQARRQGYVTTPFGRKCAVTGMNDRNPAMRGFAERAAINAPIQGGAADIIKRAMIRLPDALRDEGLTAVMLLQVHDELVFEVPEADVAAAQVVITRVMDDAAGPAVRLDVPLGVEIGLGRNWDAAH